MRGGGEAESRIGSGRVGERGWIANAGIVDAPQINGIQTSGDGAGCWAWSGCAELSQWAWQTAATWWSRRSVWPSKNVIASVDDELESAGVVVQAYAATQSWLKNSATRSVMTVSVRLASRRMVPQADWRRLCEMHCTSASNRVARRHSLAAGAVDPPAPHSGCTTCTTATFVVLVHRISFASTRWLAW